VFDSAQDGMMITDDYKGLINGSTGLSHDETNHLSHNHDPLCTLNGQSAKRWKKQKSRKRKQMLSAGLQYPCPNKCGRSYKKKASMLHHITVECGKEWTFKCPDCPKKYHYFTAYVV